MRAAVLLLSITSLAGCGQTGALYLPDESVETPVEIRGPATTPPPTAEADKDKKDEKPAPPPGR